MLSFLPGPLHGAVVMLFLIVNTVFWATPLYVMVLFKVLIPHGALRDRFSVAAAWLAQHWAVTNSIMVQLLMRIEWDLRMNMDVSPQGQYLVCANHQTWNDIFVLMRAFGKRAPFFKFFLKQELIWVPVLGLAWWGLDYPFMKRYSKEQVAKNPALKGKDLETTRKACEAFKNQPALVLNFLEGTRFTPAKHDQQKSPFRHLLKPKSGGFAFTVSALGERLNSLLDVTIVYPDGAKGFWDFCAGRVRKVIVEVRQLEVPHEFYEGDYENDPVYRERFQKWIGTLWSEKDQRIEQLLKGQ
ncbi:acyltransferase [Stenotrophobium rhamnosiphilum]|uniref:Acyltransferase n=1 Tax=Stenotrophobium rhamnosiphilum TaxID=2029166 RepID=A0A2T5MJP5_9GAMM|nr:acyltransferase [Stenotrophobium rhamnosiphilum]PTU32800.1 acyltransferase [Stenotrophobium rhamnosiphilum]